MSVQTPFVEGTEAGEPSSLGVLWWLWVPLAVLVLLVLAHLFVPGSYRELVGSERGLVEISQFLLAAATCVIALRSLAIPALRSRPWLFAWVALMAFGSFYLAGEEISWGQHFFLWGTPDTWQAINDQNETNLHNISNLFDQIPRTILELGIIVGGIVIPLAALLWPAIRRHRLSIILPPLVLLPTALLVEISRAPERLGELFVGHSLFFDRASEVQEFYFTYFILLYAILLRRRLLAAPADRP